MPITFLPFEDSLLIAAKNGHIAIIEKAIADGVFVDSRDSSHGRTLLIWTAMNGHKDLVQLLLRRNANVNAKDIWNSTALLLAIAHGHSDTSEILLRAGASMEDRDFGGHAPLTLAAEVGLFSIVQSLLAAGADIDVKDWRKRRTALSWAAEKGHEDIVDILLENNALVDEADENNRSPLVWAAMNGHSDVVKLLLRWNANTEIRDSTFGRTPFLWAIKQGHAAVIQLLKDISPPEINYGLSLHPEPPSSARLDKLQEVYRTVNPDFDWRRNQGGELLLWTIEDDREEDFKFLIEQGANADARDNNGMSALANAAKKGLLNVVKILIERVVDADPVDAFDRTPLSWAAEMGHVEITRLLLARGAYIDAADDSGATPLIHATCLGHESVVSLLLDAGANPCAEDEHSRTALSFAAENGDMSLVALFLDKGVSPDQGSEYSPLIEAVSQNNLELVKLLLESGGDPYSDLYSHVELPPLVLAACHGKTELVKVLLERTAESLQTKRDHICRALAEASYEDEYDVIEAILEQQSSFGIEKGEIDDWVLEYAKQNEYEDLIDLLRPYFSAVETDSKSDSESTLASPIRSLNAEHISDTSGC
ncbi:Ankyrin repeat domain-containing protein 50 [Penicillium rolfsii]|nr:Ankyrin repeat domain-containing protein 50 [Penicillium rolfsii]